VYIFRRTGDSWTEEAKLRPESTRSVLFGSSVAVEKDRIVVGAPDFDIDFQGPGKAYIFRRAPALNGSHSAANGHWKQPLCPATQVSWVSVSWWPSMEITS